MAMLVEVVAMMVTDIALVMEEAGNGRCSAAKYPGDMVVISCYYFIFLWSVQGSAAGAVKEAVKWSV